MGKSDIEIMNLSTEKWLINKKILKYLYSADKVSFIIR